MIRSTNNKKIMGIATGDIKKYVINGQTVKLIEGNFMCVHKKLRNKRVAALLLLEQMRRHRAMGIPHGMYTSEHSMPTPFATTHFMNRFINPSKLAEVKYTNMPAFTSFKEFDKKYALPKKETIKIKGTVRLMQKKDL